MPVRIQRKRTRGWKMPPNTIYVGRPSKWGNPWRVIDCGKWGWLVQDHTRNWYPSSKDVAVRFAATKFRRWLRTSEFARRKFDVASLRGKNLACFCSLDQPCHADVLLELANEP